MALSIEDGLSELSQLFVEYEHEPRILDPQDATRIRDCIRVLRERVRKLEHQLATRPPAVSLKMQRSEEQAVLSALSDPNGNVCLFPVIPRPFSDGRSEPREWR